LSEGFEADVLFQPDRIPQQDGGGGRQHAG
jgi:hypothetical protein